MEVEGIDASTNIVRGCALSEDDEVVAVKMNRMIVLSNSSLVRETQVLSGDNEVDIPLRVVLWDDRVKWIESGVFKIQNCRVREIEIHRSFRQIPSRVPMRWIRVKESFECVAEHIIHCVIIDEPWHNRYEAL